VLAFLKTESGEEAFFNVWQVNRTGGDLILGTLWPPGLPEQVQIYSKDSKDTVYEIQYLRVND
jgi:hypothetical protein